MVRPTWTQAKNSRRTGLEEPSFMRRYSLNKDFSLKLPSRVGCLCAALKLRLPHLCTALFMGFWLLWGSSGLQLGCF